MFLANEGRSVGEVLYVEDVFSAFTYTGTGAAQSIVNGIDLAGKGGLVWTKNRDQPDWHFLLDTARGVTNRLSSNSTNGNSADAQTITAFNSNGYSIGTDASMNTSTEKFVSWTFRKAEKFFDVVSYTGTGVARTIAHSLGVTPGMIIVKRTDSTGSWFVWHRSLGDFYLFLQSTSASAAAGADIWNDTAPTSTEFSVGTNANLNASGGTYVAYLFAHDTASDGIIQCGSFTNNGSGEGPFVNLGWEPQFLLIKQSSTTGGWGISDTSRRLGPNGTSLSSNLLEANTSAAESAGASYSGVAANGFRSGGTASATMVYMAIRKGLMRSPTDATKVFAINARTGTGAAATVTAGSITTGPDWFFAQRRPGGTPTIFDRLRGATARLATSLTNAETAESGVTAFNMDSITLGTATNQNANGETLINYLIKQARGFFDIVAYIGTGVAHTEAHNLGVVPELIIFKQRDNAANWAIYYGDNTSYMLLNTTAAAVADATMWNNTSPTTTTFSLGTNANRVNTTAINHIAYLFATLAGVSKVGTYTGNATTNQIDCGFAAGARFVLIKRIDSTGDWYFWDTTRGIIAGNDPYLLVNSNAAEVTSTDYIDPYSAGFELSSTAPAALNANGGTFLYLAIA